MKYYAVIKDRQFGPYTLEELVDAGIRPDTYVWCKGMDDWVPAEEVADICRCFRQRLSRLQHPVTTAPPAAAGGAMPAAGPSEPPEAAPDPADHNPELPPPTGLLVAAIFSIFLFPITGALATIHAMDAQKYWNESRRSDAKNSKKLYTAEERANLRDRMASNVRQCKMWTGITIFIGMMLYAAIFHFA